MDLLQVWSIVAKDDCALLTPATLAKLSLEEAASVGQLCSLLLLQHGHYLDKAAAGTVSRLLLAVLLHYSAPVRRAGIKAAGQCLAEKPALAGSHLSLMSLCCQAALIFLSASRVHGIACFAAAFIRCATCIWTPIGLNSLKQWVCEGHRFELHTVCQDSMSQLSAHAMGMNPWLCFMLFNVFYTILV